MNMIDTTSADFHDEFAVNAEQMMDQVREDLLEGPASATTEEIIGQLLINFLGGDPSLPFTADQKAQMVRVADHMGPDWCQRLYHAAVFMTKVA